MGLINDAVTGTNQVRIGERGTTGTGALHSTNKPVPYILGHYQANHRGTFGSLSATNRVLQMRNPSAERFVVLTGLAVKVGRVAVTALVDLGSLDVVRIKDFTAVDNTSITVLNPSTQVTKSSPASAILVGMISSTAGSGFIGTSIPSTMGFVPLGVGTTTLPTASVSKFNNVDLARSFSGGYPQVFARDEGFTIESRLAAAGVSLYFTVSWAEVSLTENY